MYILLVSRGIPSTKDPQWGCFEFDQAQALKSLGHKVVILSVDERIRFYRRKLGITHAVIDEEKMTSFLYVIILYILITF